MTKRKIVEEYLHFGGYHRVAKLVRNEIDTKTPRWIPRGGGDCFVK